MRDSGRCRAWTVGYPPLEYYHDHDWCRINHDDRYEFEMLVLETASVGLSWRLIMNRREAYRAAFHNFDIDRCAAMTDEELEALMDFPRLVHSRKKIYNVRRCALCVQQIIMEYGSFDAYLWSFSDGQTVDGKWTDAAQRPTESETSRKMAADMKKRGMAFVGPTIIYSYLQAIGMVNDHLADCAYRDPLRHIED